MAVVRPSTIRATVFALSTITLALGAVHFANLTADDVFISVRYAESFARGQGLVYNAGERVEGFSNPLWTMLLTIPAWLGAPRSDIGMLAATKLLSFVFALAAMAVVTWHEPPARSRWPSLPLGTVLLGTSMAYLMWASGGLETTLLALLMVACVTSWLREREHASAPGRFDWSAIWLALAALTRPEPVALIAPLFTLRLLSWPRPCRESWRAHLRYLTTFALPCLGYFAFRLAYYGLPLPNTYYAKREGDPTALGRGLSYITEALSGMNLVPIVGMSLLFVLLRRAERLRALVIVGLCAAFTVFALWEGGDWMPGHRLFIPALPLVALLVDAAWRVVTELELEQLRLPPLPPWLIRPSWVARFNDALERGAAMRPVLRGVGAATLIGVVAVGAVRSFHDWVGERGSGLEGIRLDSGGPYDAARWMRAHLPRGVLLATGEAGIVPYYTQARLIDLNGLVDAYIARLPGGRHHKFDWQYVERRNPEYVYLLVDQAPSGQLVSRTYYGREMLNRPEFHARYEQVRLFEQSVLFRRR